jgi:hypothetical protein
MFCRRVEIGRYECDWVVTCTRGERRRRCCKLANGFVVPVESAEKSRGNEGSDAWCMGGGKIGRTPASSAQSSGGTATGSVCVAATHNEREGVVDEFVLAFCVLACNSEQSFHPTSYPQTRSASNAFSRHSAASVNSSAVLLRSDSTPSVNPAIFPSQNPSSLTRARFSSP